MKILLLCLLVGTCLAGDSPFACDRAALSASVRKHHFDEVTPAVRKLLKSAKELSDGYAFELPADSLTLVAEWVSNERLCCPFLDITIQVERERGPLWLRLSGRQGTKEFIKADFARWF